MTAVVVTHDMKTVTKVADRVVMLYPLARLEPGSGDGGSSTRPARPARIVLYRRPLMARADGDEELTELVLDVVVEEFARLLGLDPQIVDPGYPGDDD